MKAAGNNRDTLSLSLKALIVLWIVLNAIDVGLTLYAAHMLAPQGIPVEMAFYMSRLPLGYSLGLKMVGALLVGVVLLRHRKLGMTIAANVGMAGFCLWNWMSIT